MTLRDCYTERSYYYPKLECEMKRIMGQNGWNGLRRAVIKTFCSEAFGDLRLASTEDYNNVLGLFRCFVDGAAWALKHYPDDD